MNLSRKRIKLTTVILTLLVIAVLIGSFFFGKWVIQSIILGGAKIDCGDQGANSWACSLSGNSNIQGDEGKINIKINEPKDADERANMLFDKAKYVSSDLKEFLDTHSVITWDSPAQTGCYSVYEPYDEGWDYKLPLRTHQYFNNYGWCLEDSFVTDILKQQLIIIEGTSPLGNFKTYGLCDANARECRVYDPFSENSVKLTPLSIDIYFKDGGYKEDDACKDFNVGCTGNYCIDGQEKCEDGIFYTCTPDNTWGEQGAVFGKCGVICNNLNPCEEKSLGKVCKDDNVHEKKEINICALTECLLTGYSFDLVKECSAGCDDGKCKEELNWLLIIPGTILAIFIIIITFVIINRKL